MADTPFWIAVGDLHDDVARLDEIPELAKAAGILVTGDITLGGSTAQAKRVLEPLAARAPRLMAQIGNMDHAEVTGWLEENGWNLHGRAQPLFPGVFAFGVGGSPFTPFGTPSEHSEEQLAEWMEAGFAEVRQLAAGSTGPAGLVLVAHTPPYGTACDRLHSGVPVGSTAVREFIEKHQPDICLCGHIHESRAEDSIGKTHVMNTGTLVGGGYAIVRFSGNGVQPAVTAELKVLP